MLQDGVAVPEIAYDIEWGVLIPPFGSLFDKASPFAIGFPSWDCFSRHFLSPSWATLILFGDVVTGAEVLRTAAPSRPDDPVDIDVRRTHLSVAIRQRCDGGLRSVLPDSRGPLDRRPRHHRQRWSEGPHALRSLFTGISSYYVFGLPVLYLTLPALTALRPLMGIALSLTLVLTGFACAYVAMAIPKSPAERGVALLMAVPLAVFANPWIGMAIGIVAWLTLVGPNPSAASAADRRKGETER